MKHSDCKNCATIDAAKGYCHCHKQIVLIDTPVCGQLDPLPKCGGCARFRADANEPDLGFCTAEKKQPWTYPDLICSGCEMYEAK